MAPSSASRSQLLQAIRRVLRPVIKVMIRAGIRFDEFSELARGVYVESALRDGLDHVSKPTRARVSMATGVSRHQVDYYLETEGALPTADPTLTNILTEVLQKWHTDPLYVGPYGIPLELEFEVIGGGRCVRNLVAMVDRKVSPGVVLEELISQGAVTYSGEKHYRATSRYLLMREPMSAPQIEYFGNVLTRLTETLEFNMNPKNSTKRLERFVVADRGLPADVVPKFEVYARDRSMELLVDLDNWLTPYSGPATTEEESSRIQTGLNVFLYIEPAPDERLLSSLVNDTRPLK